MTAPAHHLVVGGQRSGKSRHAEGLARAWLDRDPARHAVTVVATARAGDDEMRARIERHRRDRPAGFATVEEPLGLAAVLATHSTPGRLLLVDCLTLWLTNALMPAQPTTGLAGRWPRERALLLELLPRLPGPVVLVSNEVGWGVSPLSREVRDFIDELGRLNQDIARRCATLTLMVAGQPWSRPVEPQA